MKGDTYLTRRPFGLGEAPTRNTTCIVSSDNTIVFLLQNFCENLIYIFHAYRTLPFTIFSLTIFKNRKLRKDVCSVVNKQKQKQQQRKALF